MLKCSTNGNGLHSHYWRHSFSKALSADSKQFSPVCLCFAMCFGDGKDKTRALGSRYMNYFISLLPTFAQSAYSLLDGP